MGRRRTQFIALSYGLALAVLNWIRPEICKMCCWLLLVVDALRRLPVQPLGPILPAPCAISLPLSTLAGIPPNTGKTTQLKATEERTLEKPGMLSDQILDKCSPPIHAFNENWPKPDIQDKLDVKVVSFLTCLLYSGCSKASFSRRIELGERTESLLWGTETNQLFSWLSWVVLSAKL